LTLFPTRTSAASRFILERVYAAMLMADVSKSLRVMAVVDEAHKLCGDETSQR
jgi:hypothetical protein